MVDGYEGRTPKHCDEDPDDDQRYQDYSQDDEDQGSDRKSLPSIFADVILLLATCSGCGIR